MKFKILYGLFLLCFGCHEASSNSGDAPSSSNERTLPAKINYDFDCLDGKANNKVVVRMQDAGEVLRRMTTDKIKVTDDEQSDFGDEFLKEVETGNGMKLDPDHPLNEKLNFILKDLLRKRIDPSNIRYSIYLLDDKVTINAFTFGGKIFVTKAIIGRCKTDDELYAIVGHEIGHNEKGHIKSSIQELKYTQKIAGNNAEMLIGLKKFVFAIFNQKDELEADYYGLNLVYMLGKNPCAISSFWEAMAKDEGEYNAMEDFLRSHPFSSQRVHCITNYLKTNFNFACK